MNATALAGTVAVALRSNLRRLTPWVFASVFVLIVVLLYAGNLSFGGMTATGAKLAVNSEYAIAAILGAFSFMLMHFTATLTGDPVVRDERLRVAPLLAASPLDARTYLLGKFLGGYASLLSVYAIFLVALLFGQVLPAGPHKEVLAFTFLPYLKFAFLFVLVPTFFVGAISFALGTLSGSMKVVYMAVTGFLVAWFLVMNGLENAEWRFLVYFEPSGMAWLAEQVARSRGNAWLNEHAIWPDAGFALNRLGMLLIGLAALELTVRRYARGSQSTEYGGEIRPGRLARSLRWLLGRPAEIEDPYTSWTGQGSAPRVEPSPSGAGTWWSALVGSTRTELRLLAAERSLWIVAPIVMLFCGVDAVSHTGAFGLPIYPVSSEYAVQMVPVMLVVLVGTTIFYTGEVFHRDDANRVRSLIYSTPVSSSALLLGKLFAMLVLSWALVLLGFATGIVAQALAWFSLDGRFYLDLLPYAEIGLWVLLPATLVLCTLALVVNTLLRGRYLAYFALLVMAGGYVWLLMEGERSLLYNPLLFGHWAYSDMTGLEPFRARLAPSHLYWGAVLLAALCAASWFLARTTATPWTLRPYLRRSYAARRVPLLVLGLGALTLALVQGRRLHVLGNQRGNEAELEQALLDQERRYASERDAPRLAFESVDLDVRLYPELGRLDASGSARLVNVYQEPIARARFQVDPLFEIRRFELERARQAWSLDRSVLTVELDPPLATGETALLRFDWSGDLQPGFPRDGGPQSTFVHRDAVFVSSFAPEVLPIPGISARLFLSDPERRRAHGLGELEQLADLTGTARVPCLFGSDLPFDLTARIVAPARLDVLCGGELVGREEFDSPDGGPRLARTTFRTRRPVVSFAILAAEYEQLAVGDDELHYHSGHGFNLESIAEALADGREFFERSFGPYPHRQLRIGEFPRLASFAQSYPTLMPYSESIGFLTNHRETDRFVDATYFVTAHEVAHQWWGYIVSPGASQGAQVLIESLAEYSAMVLLDEHRGERERLIFLQREEDQYLRRRDPDLEKPLAELELSSGMVPYTKGCQVFYMLERQIGRERVLAGLRDFVARWRHLEDEQRPDRLARARRHPVLSDLLDELRAQHRREDLAWFYDQWFQSIVVPDMAFDGEPILREEGGAWTVEFRATNHGSGRMPVVVEALRGPWRPEQREADEEFDVSPGLRLFLAPGESVQGMLASTFRPDAVVIDRLYECLDFDRTNNVHSFGAGESDPPPARPAPEGPGAPSHN